MLLKNIAKRLITINGAMSNNVRKVAYQIKPGNNPAVEVPDELCRNKFVKGLIDEGSLEVVNQPAAPVEVETTSEYDDMTKGDLKEYAESLGIDVKSAWSKVEIIAEIVKVEAE